MLKSANVISEWKDLFFYFVEEQGIFENITFCLSYIFPYSFVAVKYFHEQEKLLIYRIFLQEV